MKFLLDANAWIGHLRQRSQTVTYRFRQHPASDVVLCSVVLAELLYGAERSGPAHRAANFALIAQLRQQYLCLPFDDPAAEEYGRIRSHLANQGTPIGPNDLLIAAIALANKITLRHPQHGRVQPRPRPESGGLADSLRVPSNVGNALPRSSASHLPSQDRPAD
jgi:tRNA(fMet)-specific endonuclease VapC